MGFRLSKHASDGARAVQIPERKERLQSTHSSVDLVRRNNVQTTPRAPNHAGNVVEHTIGLQNTNMVVVRMKLEKKDDVSSRCRETASASFWRNAPPSGR